MCHTTLSLRFLMTKLPTFTQYKRNKFKAKKLYSVRYFLKSHILSVITNYVVVFHFKNSQILNFEIPIREKHNRAILSFLDKVVQFYLRKYMVLLRSGTTYFKRLLGKNFASFYLEILLASSKSSHLQFMIRDNGKCDSRKPNA